MPMTTLEKAQLERCRADTRLKDQEHARRSGELIDLAAFIQLVTPAFLVMKQIVLTSSLEPAEQDELLNAMSKALADCADGAGMKKPTATTAVPGRRKGGQHGALYPGRT